MKYFKKLQNIIFTLLLLATFIPSVAFGAFTDGVWANFGTYAKPNVVNGLNLLISGTDKYLNWGSTTGSSGYGLRDNSGTIEFKNSGGSWAGLGSGGGGSTFIGLTDVPASFVGQGTKFVRVNGAETALEFATVSGGGDALTSAPLSQFASTTSAQLAGVISNETGSGALVFATSPTLVTPALGTPSSGTLTNATGLPISSGLTGAGTGVLTALGVNVGSAGSFLVNGGALGTPSSGTLTNATGLPIAGITGLATGIDTFLATPSSVNVATAVTDETGSGALVFSTSPTFVTPILGTPTSATLTNATGLPISTGVSGLASGIATFLGTPSSANLASAITNETGSGVLVFGTSPTITTPTIAKLANLTSNGFVKTSGGDGTLSVDTSTYLTGNESITLSGDVSGTGSTGITTTIGADKILESMLKAVDTASDEECLSYEATVGDFEWQTCGGGGTISGTDTHVLFFDGTDNPAGEAGLTYNKTTDTITVAGVVSTPTLTLSGTGTINGLDSIDGTSETTLESTIDIAGDISGTGLTAVTIGADKVLESHLKAVDSATDEECLTYESTTGDFEWQTCGGGGSGITVGSTTITSGASGRIPFNNAGTYDEDAFLTWNDTDQMLITGGGTITGMTPTVNTESIFAVKSSNSYFAGLSNQNTSNGTTASSDIIAYNDTGTNYINMGIASSGNTDALFTSGQANSSYLYGYGEQLTIGTATSGKSLQFITGGTLTANIRATIDGNGKFTSFDKSLATTQSLTTGIAVENSTVATSGAQKISPAIKLSGNGWKTNATAGSQPVTVGLWALPVQGSANPLSSLVIGESINGGAFSNIMVISGNTSAIAFSKSNSGLAKIYPSNDGAGTETSGGSGLFVGFQSGSSSGGTTATTLGSTGTFTPTSGLNRMLKVIGNHNATTGSGSHTMIEAGSTINQAGTSGAWRGVHINPTLTAYTDIRGFSMSTTSTISSATTPLMKAIDIQNTFNHTGSVTNSIINDIFVNDVETSLTGTTHNFLDFQISGTSKFKVRNSGLLVFETTITGGGTTGNQTINKPTGTVNFASASSAITVTNSRVTASSTVLAQARTDDATCSVKNVVPASGSFVINMTATCTAETSVGFLVINE